MNFIKKILLVFLGVSLIGMGAAISLVNNWGSDPVTVFAQSISLKLESLGWNFFSVGNTLIFINLLIFIFLIIRYKFKYIQIGTFAGMFCVGLFIDEWVKLLTDIILLNDSVVFKIIWMFVGTIILAAGIGLYVSSEMGAAPVDLISVIISEYFKLKYFWVRMICDLIFVIFGWLLGGVVGLSTILCMILVGPISGVVIKNIKKYLNSDRSGDKIINESQTTK